MNILVTGGTGFIGSHTVVKLLEAGHDVTIIDNLTNSSSDMLDSIEKIADKRPVFMKADIRDKEALEYIFSKNEENGTPFNVCIHFAGLKAVGESVEKPLLYYDNNVCGSITLLEVMEKHGCRNLIFSSSATVYGDPTYIPITEEHKTGACTNPYGKTKAMQEDIMKDLQNSDPRWNIVLLRYFNPIGANPSGLIGENPKGIPNNLMPYIAKVAEGSLESLGVFGDDYPTPDGTGVRDYIHVEDLAEGHVSALE